MTHIIVSKDCGNSPKNILIQKLSIAFAEVDTNYLLNVIADDIRWNIIGEKLIQGKNDFTEALVALEKCEVKQLSVLHALSHGKVGAVDGRKKMCNGKIFAYCDVYEFTGAKYTRVEEITSFVVEVK